MINIIVTYKVKRSKLNIIKKAIRDFVSNVQKKEPGTYFYGAYQKKDKVSFVHVMCFKNRKAERIHKNSEHCKRFVSVLYPVCTKKPIFINLNLVKSNRK